MATLVINVTDAAAADPIEDVSIRIWSEDGETFVTEGSTDEEGNLTLDVPAATYSVRFFKSGFSFGRNILMEVLEEGDGDNIFDIEATDLNALPISTDVLLCRVTGAAVNGGGAPSSGVLTVDVQAIWPTSFRGMIVAEKLRVVSRAVQRRAVLDFQLIQGGIYEIDGLPSMAQSIRICVPDVRAISIRDLLNPAPDHVVWGAAVSVSEGETYTRTIALAFAGGLRVPHSWHTSDDAIHSLHDHITVDTDDHDIATVALDGETGQLSILGVSAGTTTVRATLTDVAARRAAAHVPAPTVTLGTLSVTVAV